jgi:hypothetical protein
MGPARGETPQFSQKIIKEHIKTSLNEYSLLLKR